MDTTQAYSSQTDIDAPDSSPKASVEYIPNELGSGDFAPSDPPLEESAPTEVGTIDGPGNAEASALLGEPHTAPHWKSADEVRSTASQPDIAPLQALSTTALAQSAQPAQKGYLGESSVEGSEEISFVSISQVVDDQVEPVAEDLEVVDPEHSGEVVDGELEGAAKVTLTAVDSPISGNPHLSSELKPVEVLAAEPLGSGNQVASVNEGSGIPATDAPQRYGWNDIQVADSGNDDPPTAALADTSADTTGQPAELDTPVPSMNADLPSDSQPGDYDRRSSSLFQTPQPEEDISLRPSFRDPSVCSIPIPISSMVPLRKLNNGGSQAGQSAPTSRPSWLPIPVTRLKRDPSTPGDKSATGILDGGGDQTSHSHLLPSASPTGGGKAASASSVSFTKPAVCPSNALHLMEYDARKSRAGHRLTVLRQTGFALEVGTPTLESGDEMDAVLCTKTNIAQHPLAKLPLHPGPLLPGLESRPLTIWLRNKYSMAAFAHRAPDDNFSPYSHPLPITRESIPIQKTPARRHHLVRELRNQRELALEAIYLGPTAIPAKSFFKQHTTHTQTAKLSSNAESQPLAPSFSGTRPSHETYRYLGSVHWQEYSRRQPSAQPKSSSGYPPVPSSNNTRPSSTNRSVASAGHATGELAIVTKRSSTLTPSKPRHSLLPVSHQLPLNLHEYPPNRAHAALPDRPFVVPGVKGGDVSYRIPGLPFAKRNYSTLPHQQRRVQRSVKSIPKKPTELHVLDYQSAPMEKSSESQKISV
ncbi:uncharacterized protein BJ171DRAFT_272440 [Polychytrium aggregatum]|uniref:uncharacterized protein n=1 Tax=Polychytrium aggregatum TaxID=110093 RepID=UPI0022FE3463|nr:uncharacterized protein BJ171DRAFT_272440 [Polychytrium aggregatum]KAI9193300.1 hypothetical protein BJ171DRAFT_272440 [Polychytrium aggregatum]